MREVMKLTLSLITIWTISAQICTVGTDINGNSCSSNCFSCSTTTCYSCCPRYYLLGGLCYPCTDANCLFCSYSSGQTCTTCMSGYGKNIYDPIKCTSCSTSTAVFCSSSNNCGSTSTCATCPYAMSPMGICQSCSSIYRNCFTCDNSRCLSCNGNYVLNLTANNRECVACNVTNCAFCNDGPICANCYTGFYRNSLGICTECKYPCLDCANISYCFSCENASQLYVRSSGVCHQCSYFMTGCLTCSNSSSLCYSCSNGYYLNGGTCYSCPSPCSTCSSSSTCLTCISISYALNGGTCSSCSSIMSNCLTCLSNSVCRTCATGYFLNANAAACVTCSSYFSNCLDCTTYDCISCAAGHTLSSGRCLPEPCTSPCLTCSPTPTTCLSCVDGYYFDGTSCQLCDVSCLTCSAFSTCTKCSPILLLNASSCVACPIQQYHNIYTRTCLPCPAHCNTCIMSSGCETCQPFFGLQMVAGINLCIDICGDGYAMGDACDLGIGIKNDGCTDDCKVETNYVCTNTLGTTVVNGVSYSTNKSGCSYTGQVKAELTAASESLFLNQLSLTFTISPYLAGLPKNGATQAELQSLFALLPLTTASTYEIKIDDQLGTVTFILDHTADLSNTAFALHINFASLSTNSMFQYLTNTIYPFSPLISIQSTTRLGLIESQTDRSSAQVVYFWSAAISFFSLAFLLIGCFSKQLAGLEQTLLCQSAYLLLLFKNEQFPLSLLSLSGFRYSLGIGFLTEKNKLVNHASYVLGVDITSIVNNFGGNFCLYFLPLVISLIFLAYKLRFKHLPVKKDFGQQISQNMIGQTLFYVVIFNLGGFISFSYLFFSLSYDNHHFWSIVVIFCSGIFTLFGFYNFTFRPELMGFFRGAFRYESEFRETTRNESIYVKKINAFLALRPCGATHKEFYTRLCINYYYIYLSYIIGFMTILLLSPSFSLFLILGLQLLLLTFLIIVKPYFNPHEKLRSVLTFLLLLLLTTINILESKSFDLIFVFLAFLTLHAIYCGYITIRSMIDHMKRKCNDRTKVVKKLFEDSGHLQQEERLEHEKMIMKELIKRYQMADRNMMSMDRTIEKVQMNNDTHQQRPEDPQKLDKTDANNKQKDQDAINFQEEIIVEENEHLRYQKGLDFIRKYGKVVEHRLIDSYYEDI